MSGLRQSNTLRNHEERETSVLLTHQATQDAAHFDLDTMLCPESRLESLWSEQKVKGRLWRDSMLESLWSEQKVKCGWPAAVIWKSNMLEKLHKTQSPRRFQHTLYSLYSLYCTRTHASRIAETMAKCMYAKCMYAHTHASRIAETSSSIHAHTRFDSRYGFMKRESGGSKELA